MTIKQHHSTITKLVKDYDECLLESESVEVLKQLCEELTKSADMPCIADHSLLMDVLALENKIHSVVNERDRALIYIESIQNASKMGAVQISSLEHTCATLNESNEAIFQSHVHRHSSTILALKVALESEIYKTSVTNVSLQSVQSELALALNDVVLLDTALAGSETLAHAASKSMAGTLMENESLKLALLDKQKEVELAHATHISELQSCEQQLYDRDMQLKRLINTDETLQYIIAELENTRLDLDEAALRNDVLIHQYETIIAATQRESDGIISDIRSALETTRCAYDDSVSQHRLSLDKCAKDLEAAAQHATSQMQTIVELENALVVSEEVIEILEEKLGRVRTE